MVIYFCKNYELLLGVLNFILQILMLFFLSAMNMKEQDTEALGGLKEG